MPFGDVSAMKLYGYFRSSAAFRVRIALNLKGLAYGQVPVHLRKNEQQKPDFLALQPQGLVPALMLHFPDRTPWAPHYPRPNFRIPQGVTRSSTERSAETPTPDRSRF